MEKTKKTGNHRTRINPILPNRPQLVLFSQHSKILSSVICGVLIKNKSVRKAQPKNHFLKGLLTVQRMTKGVYIWLNLQRI